MVRKGDAPAGISMEDPKQFRSTVEEWDLLLRTGFALPRNPAESTNLPDSSVTGLSSLTNRQIDEMLAGMELRRKQRAVVLGLDSIEPLSTALVCVAVSLS